MSERHLRSLEPMAPKRVARSSVSGGDGSALVVVARRRRRHSLHLVPSSSSSAAMASSKKAAGADPVGRCVEALDLHGCGRGLALSLAVLRGDGGSKPATRRWRHHILQPVPLVSFLGGDAGSRPAARRRRARTP